MNFHGKFIASARSPFKKKSQGIHSMSMIISPQVASVEAPPIAEAMSWVHAGPRNRTFLNLCQAVPSYPPAATLQAEFARLAQTDGIGGYTNIYGLEALRQAHAAAMGADYAAQIPARQVAITTGCNQAFAAATLTVAQAGDTVVMPTPWYFNHQMWLKMLGVGIQAIPAFAAGRNYPSVDDAAKAITATTRAIVLCTPNNPTGAIYPAEVIHAFFELAQRKGLALILDETYKDFRPDAAPSHELFNRPDWEDTLIQLYSFSKVYALAGYRLGSMISSEKTLAEAAKVLDCMTICPPHITQAGVVFALRELQPWKQEKLNLMAGRLAAIRAAFQHPDLKYEMVSSGAYFAYVKHPFQGELSKTVAMRLAQEHDVLCLPGIMFGSGQEDYLRFAFANVDGALMQPLVERLLGAQ
jgi:aspartate/methionine/tyrosine aminotransferase